MKSDLITQVENGIARVTINRPEVRNALSSEMLQDMLRFIQSLKADESVRAVVITGTGAHFAAGGDVKSFASMLSMPPDELRADFERRSDDAAPLWIALNNLSQPVVCAVRGFSAGVALSLVAGSDYAIASENAYFLLAHVGIGLVADGAATYHLPRTIGVRKAKEMAFFGDRIDAAQALSIGLINKIVPDAALEYETEAVLARLAAAPAMSIACAKQLINASLQNTIEQQLALETSSVGACGASADVIEGVRAFVEKRRPQFGQKIQL